MAAINWGEDEEDRVIEDRERRREEEEKQWEEESIRRQIAERNESNESEENGTNDTGISWNPNPDYNAHRKRIQDYVENQGNVYNPDSGISYNPNVDTDITEPTESTEPIEPTAPTEQTEPQTPEPETENFAASVSVEPTAENAEAAQPPDNLTLSYNPLAVSTEETAVERKERNGYRNAESKTPVVYEGSSLRTPRERMARANLKQELEDETSTGVLPADFWDWTAERQQEYLSNPTNMTTAIGQANRQAEQARRDAAELRANRQHYLGAGPTEPGTMNWTTATGPVLPGHDNYGLGKPPHDYQAPYTYNPELSQAVAIDAMNANPYYQDPAVLAYAAQLRQDALDQISRNNMPQGPQTSGYFSGANQPGARGVPDNGILFGGANGSTLPAPQVVDRNAPDYQAPRFTPDTRGLNLNPVDYGAALENIENEQLNYERGLADYIQNNGAQLENNGSVPIAEWFRQGRQENPIYQAAYDLAYQEAIANGSSAFAAEQAASNAGDTAIRNYRTNLPAAPEQPAPEGKSFYDSMMDTGGDRNGEPGNQRYVYRGEGPVAGGQEAGTGGPTRKPDNSAGGAAAGNRPGAEAVVNSWDGSAPVYDPGAQQNQRYVYRGEGPGAGSGTGTGTGTGSGTGSGTGTGAGTRSGTGAGKGSGTGSGTGSKTDVPKGSKYYRPSYGQEGSVVKAPYRKGGYTAAEIESMGNKARPDRKYYNGNKAYEGYYLAPDGKYYPVDQEKANYYRQYGTYNGWQEGMRDYWNTFGTFYGYRPDWKTAGRSGGGGGKSYGRGGGGGAAASSSTRLRLSGNSYNGGGSGYSYGRGSTANNGLYYNPNTSWNI